MMDTLWLFFYKMFSVQFILVNDSFSVTCSSFRSMAGLSIELRMKFCHCRTVMVQACVGQVMDAD